MSITAIIAIITGIVSAQCFQRPFLLQRWAHHPYSVANNNEWYRMLSSGFVHGSWAHLLINMFVFWMFGERIEYYFVQIWGVLPGRMYFLMVYLLTIAFANIPSQFRNKNNPSYFSLGASGGVSGIVFIFILFHPWEKLYLYFVIPIYGIIAGLLYLVYSHWASKNSSDNIDHSAHFYGAIIGIVLTLVLKPSLGILFLDRLISGWPL